MEARIFQLDAFSSRSFAGNPAAVMLFESYPDDGVCQALANENNLAETAFLVAEGGDFRIRWFTPTVEVPLCGHATLASAAVVLERLETDRESVVFHSASGPLTVRRAERGYLMDFPARQCEPMKPPENLADVLGVPVEETAWDGFNIIAVLASADDVRCLSPDLRAIQSMACAGVIVTAPGDGENDCVSRYFAPAKGIPEDPATGGAHCALTPYWAERLGKNEIYAFQTSARGGELRCRLLGDRVELQGECVFYLEGIARW
ncbi:PhzF family phenazine biosynthesis protein [Sphingomonas qilianensis]|uniref:PhzF family phenazine biosynthesis protein n=1 Tax=Sphingomonas qilianensis TaxID=1736690 RepID=A0ABU9XSX6_9SPHN